MAENSMVLRFCDIDQDEVTTLQGQYQLEICIVEKGQNIPGSYWGDAEAGLIGNQLYLRSDTPYTHCCMDAERREKLHTDAGSDIAEENAVCYLQNTVS